MSLEKGLIGHWTFNLSDTSSGTLYDSSAYDYHGIIKNGPIPTTDSVLGDAYSFDGSSSNRYVDVPDSVQSKIDGNEEASIAVWMKLPYNSADNGDNTGPFSFQGSGTSNTHWVWTNGDGYFPTFRTSRVDNVPTDSIDLTNWHHLAITTEPGADGWKLYINGEEHYSVDGQATVSADDQALIGWNNANHYFKGDMSDFRLYDRALSKMEISALYNMRSQRQQTNDLAKGLVGHWTMDDADTSGGTIYDRSAYGNHGNISGTLTTQSSGLIDNSYKFSDNNDGTVELGGGILNVGDVSVSFWFNMSQSNGGDVINFQNDIKLIIDCGGQTNGEIAVWDGSWNNTGITFETDIWNHLTVTYDNSVGEIQVYLNSSLEKMFSSSISTGNGSGVTIGADDSGSRPFDGRLDDMRVYDCVLSESEISNLYNKRT